MRAIHRKAAHNTPFLQLPTSPQYRLFHQYLTQTARATGNRLTNNKDIKTAYRDSASAQHLCPVLATTPSTPVGSKHEFLLPVTGKVLPLTLLLAPNEAKPAQTTGIRHRAKWPIPKHHMTPEELPAIPHDTQQMPRTCCPYCTS